MFRFFDPLMNIFHILIHHDVYAAFAFKANIAEMYFTEMVIKEEFYDVAFPLLRAMGLICRMSIPKISKM